MCLLYSLILFAYISFAGINRCLEMLNLSPSSYRNVDVSQRTVSSKKVYSRRPWYAPPIDPAEILGAQDPYIPGEMQLNKVTYFINLPIP